MAAPVEFRTYTPANQRQDLIRRVEEAPAEHAEAVLAAFDLLEQLHDKEVLRILTGLVSAKDTVINHVVGLMTLPEALSSMRILLMLANAFKAIDPEKIQAALHPESDKAPSLLAIAKTATSEDARRGMAAGLALLTAFGETLEKKTEQATAK